MVLGDDRGGRGKGEAARPEEGEPDGDSALAYTKGEMDAVILVHSRTEDEFALGAALLAADQSDSVERQQVRSHRPVRFAGDVPLLPVDFRADLASLDHEGSAGEAAAQPNRADDVDPFALPPAESRPRGRGGVEGHGARVVELDLEAQPNAVDPGIDEGAGAGVQHQILGPRRRWSEVEERCRDAPENPPEPHVVSLRCRAREQLRDRSLRQADVAA